MKETKVYLNKMPESCWDCFCQDDENGRCKILSKYTYYVPKDYPLIDIKTHDRELVKEVCEKIREYLRTQVIYCGGKATELDIMIASAGNQVLEDVKQFLDQIQKLEGEDE